MNIVEIAKLKPQEAVQKLEQLSLNSSSTNIGDLYIRLYLAVVLGDKCNFDIEKIQQTITFFKGCHSTKVASTFFECLSKDGKRSLQKLDPSPDQLTSIVDTCSLVQTIYNSKFVWTKLFPSLPKFSDLNISEFEANLKKLKEVLLNMRIPSKRKPNREIELEMYCSKILGYSREKVLNSSDQQTLYSLLLSLVGPEMIREEFSSLEQLQFIMESLLDRFIQEEKYSRFLKETIPADIKNRKELFRNDKAIEEEEEEERGTTKEVDEYLDNTDFEFIIDLANLLDIHIPSKIYLLAKYDEIIEAMKKKLVDFIEIWNRANYSPKEIFGTIATTEKRTREGKANLFSSVMIDSSCVISKIVRGDGFIIREIGIRCDGIYSRQPGDNELQQKFKCGSSLKHYFSRQECESGKSLDSMLSMDYSSNHDPIKFIVFVLDGSNFELDVEKWIPLSKHVGYHTLSTTPSLSTGFEHLKNDIQQRNGADDSIPFQRVMMQVRITQDDVEHSGIKKIAKELEIISSSHPVSEAGEVLADALRFVYLYDSAGKDSFEAKLAKLKEYPNLLYQLSDSMRKNAFPTIAGLVEVYWKNVLLLNSKYDSIIMSEAKKLLWDLIVTAHDQPHVALASTDHLRYISKFISENTKHMYYALSVEKSNFHTIFRTIEDINKRTAIAFCSIQIAGKMSGLDISRLVEQSLHGNIRILITFSPQVLLSLQITQKIDNVRVPVTLRKTHQTRVCQYTSASLVGEIILHAHTEWKGKSITLHEDLERTRDLLHLRQNWAKEFKTWLAMQVDEQNASSLLYRLIVCDDSDYVETTLNECKGETNIIVFNCHERDIEEEISHYFGTNEPESEVKPLSGNNLFLVLNAHLLSEYHQLQVASYVTSYGHRLVLCMPAFNPEVLTLRISSNRTLQGELWQPIAEWNQIASEEIVKRSLKMFFGPLFRFPLFSMDKNQMKEALTEACGFLSTDTKILGSIIEALFDADSVAQDDSLHVQIARLCVRSVKRNPSVTDDISFFNFVTNSHTCQWLPQVQRVVCWISTVLLADSESDATILAKQCQRLGTNIHSLHLMAFFAEEYQNMCKSNSNLDEISLGMAPSYVYVSGDNSISKQELVLQQCVQWSELNWEDTGLGFFTLDLIMNLVGAYFQPLKLLATIPPASLFHLLESATKERYSTSIEILLRHLTPFFKPTILKSLFSNLESAKIFVSVLKWSLLSSGCLSADDIPVEPEDIQNLILSRIPIFVDKPGAARVTVPLILALEGPTGIIYQQTGLRDYLLNDTAHDFFSEKKSPNLGIATLEFIFTLSIKEALKTNHDHSKLFMSNRFLLGLVSWLEKGSVQHKSIVESQIWRLSESALAFFIFQASKVDTASWVSVLMKYVQKANNNNNNNTIDHNILNNVLRQLKSLNPSSNQVATIICALLESDTTIQIQLKDPFLDALAQSIKEESLSYLEGYFNSRREDTVKECLPLDSCKILVKLYLAQYTDKNINYPNVDYSTQVQLHRSWLTDAGNQTIFDALQADKQSHKTRRFMCFLFWLFCPYRNILFLPDKQEMQFFRKLVEETDLADRIQSNLASASQFAKLLVSPYCLSTGILNHYCEVIGEHLISERKYLVAMENENFPLVLHVPSRRIPFELQEYYQKMTFDFEDVHFSHENMFGLDISSGVDEQRVKQNLAALRHILYSIDKKEIVWHLREYDSSFWFMASMIIAWFWAMGIETSTVEQWISTPNQPQLSISEILRNYTEDLGKPITQQPLLLPLPHFVDVHVRLPQTLYLHNDSEEDRLLTFQYFSSFLLPLHEPEQDLFQYFFHNESYSHKNASNHGGDRFGHLVSKHIAPQISNTKSYNHNALRMEFFDYPDLDKIVDLCQPFVSALCDLHDSNPDMANNMLESAISSSAGYSHFVSHYLFTCLPMASSPLLSHMVHFMTTKNLKFCYHCSLEFDEISAFLREHQPDKMSQVWKSFNKENLQRILFKAGNNSNLPKINELDIPSSTALIYNTKLLQSTFLNKNQSIQPQNMDYSLMPQFHKANNIFCGSKAQNVQCDPIFIHKEAQTNSTYSSAPSTSTYPKILANGISIFHCHDLLKVECKKGFAIFSVTVGTISYLIKVMRDGVLSFQFVTGARLHEANIDKSLVVASYSSHEEAWLDISKNTPSSSLVLLDGLVLFKTPQRQWVPYVVATVQDFQNINKNIYFFDLVNIAPLLGVTLVPEVVRFLLLLCRWLFRLCYNSKLHPYPPQSDTKDTIISWFSSLAWEDSGEDIHNKANRKEVGNLANKIAKFLLRVIPRLADNKKQRIVEIVKEVVQQEDGEWSGDILELWPPIANMLEFHLQATIFHHSQLEKILNQTFLENNPFLSKEVLQSCAKFLQGVVPFETKDFGIEPSTPAKPVVKKTVSSFDDDDGEFSDEEEDKQEDNKSNNDEDNAESESIEESDDELNGEQNNVGEEEQNNVDDEIIDGGSGDEEEEDDQDPLGEDESGDDNEDDYDPLGEDDHEGESENANEDESEDQGESGVSEQDTKKVLNSEDNKRKQKNDKSFREERIEADETNKSGIRLQVKAMFGKDPPLYLAFLDPIRHKNSYDMANGRILGYIMHSNLYCMADKKEEDFTWWLLDILRSPLSDAHKDWFLTRCQVKSLLIPPRVNNLKNEINSLLVSYCLAGVCPISVLRAELGGAANPLPMEVRHLVSRKNNEYGVHFCTSDALRELQTEGFHISVLDFSHIASSTAKAMDDLYLKIISQFSGLHCFVYVRGLEYLDDLFLKWCCEYTRRCPWRFIYFENTDSTFNFSENRDRCSYDNLHSHLAVQRESNVVQYSCPVSSSNESNQPIQQFFSLFGLECDWPTESLAKGDWIHEIREDYKSSSQCLLHNISPPGAGKTYLWNSIMQKERRINKRHAVHVDCSNDELVERSMASLLNERFPHEGRLSLLIADEFHMLSPYHKEELIGWVLQRMDWLKVVLVANRSDSKDAALLEEAKKQITPSSTCIIKQYQCCLSLPFIKDFIMREKLVKTTTEQDQTIHFVVVWHRVCRALFSHESLSLRTVKRLLEEYQKPKANVTEFINNLTSVLFPKLPFLGEFFCRKFTQHLWDIFQDNQANDRTLPKGETSPIKLLIRTGMADIEGKFISFPEFSTRMKASHNVHPAIRIAAWVKTVWKSLGEKEEDIVPELKCLGRLQIIDQAKFPFIKSETAATDFSRGEVFSKAGNFNDIAWLSDTINHGHAVNWTLVKEAWQKTFISSSREFSHLLSVCQDPEACLASVAPKNLSILIEGDEGCTISEKCVECLQSTENINDPNSVYFTAAWNLFRNAPTRFHELKINRLDTLMWASQFAFSLTRVKDHPVECSTKLQSVLVKETTSLFESEDPKKIEMIINMWSYLFAGLLVVGNEKGISHTIALELSRKTSPIPFEWPEVIKLLAQVKATTVTNSQLETIYESGFFALSNSRHTNEATQLDAEFIVALLSLPKRVLGTRWQTAILTSNIKLQNGFSKIISVLEDGLREVEVQKITLSEVNLDAFLKNRK